MFFMQQRLLYPEINIELNLGARHEIISNIQSGETDIALMTYQPTSDDLFFIEFCQDEIFAVIHQEHFFNEKEYIEPSSFANVHLLINSFPLEGVAVYEHCLRPINITPKKITAIPFTEISLSMVAANIGVMCAPQWQLKPFKMSKELRFKRIGKNGIKRIHYLVVKRDVLHKKYINNFIATFEEEFIDRPKGK